MADIVFGKSKWPHAKLVLETGDCWEGRNFGAKKSIAGEVVFATGMVGYPEALTDPSYQGQILVLTYPMIGNYGVPDPNARDKWGLTQHFESENGKIYISGLVVSEYCEVPSHWQELLTLHQWLEGQGIPALMGVDTRNIVLRLRDKGSRLGKILYENEETAFVDINKMHLIRQVSTKNRHTFGHGDMTILCLDLGIKFNTIRCFLRFNVTFVIVPFDWDISKEDYDGLFISNGPGDPGMAVEVTRSVKWAMKQVPPKPMFGICMGNQIMALAAGAKTYKLPFGHRGQNQPCLCTQTGNILITTQNHGFAVDHHQLPLDWEAFFINMNDRTNEGIRHKTKPFFAVQFHPEARCGPKDTEYLFGDFIKKIEKFRAEEYVRNTPSKVLVLGAGGITIAQAGEFDYSGSQCLKSLREEGIETVLVNPNIATVQTERGMADRVYYVPVTADQVERVIAKERPDGILLGWGGQTALNCGVALKRAGVLKKYGVRVLGTPISAIDITEDRQLFRDTLLEIDEHVAPSDPAESLEEAVKIARRIGYPVMVRAAYTLGGQGSGICNTEDDLRALVPIALASSPQVLVEKSVAGWKEVEYEVVRDIYDNTVIVCNMENFDPMGVHTGESMVVAPSQTLTNDEYHMLRTAAVKIVRHLGIVGECNIQYGLNPKSHEYVVIEVNARLSRSSALASKATGYPLAHVAVKLALGKALHEVTNSVVKVTNACFEPSLDYIVMKVPRWDLNKFNMVSHRLGSMMKSVGEVMAIGRTFEEVCQKSLRMVDSANIGFEVPDNCNWNFEDEIRNPTPRRIFALAIALKQGYPVEKLHEMCRVDQFFLTKLRNIIQLGDFIKDNYRSPASLDLELLRQAKQFGFCDQQIAKRIGCTEREVRQRRLELGVLPMVKQIDTVAGEFPAQTSYLYLSYNAYADDVAFGTPMHVVLGSGVYRIGNSVEFDYSGVIVARELRKRDLKVLMINYNPETVSTDYDECDRLYFDELSHETVLDILYKEKAAGVIMSVGGQNAQNLCLGLKQEGLPILGTDPVDVDKAEDRNKFSALCDTLGIAQPAWASLATEVEVHKFAARVGYPILVRPSYVLSGSAMAVIWNDTDVARYLEGATLVSGKHPVVISKYHTNAMEYDVDLVAFRGKVLCYAVCEHVENAGVHSGDATMFLPPQRTDAATMAAILRETSAIAAALNVIGPMNIQFLKTAEGEIKVIEANVRSARSVPFVSKILGISFPKVMVDAMLASSDCPPAVIPQDLSTIKTIGCKMSMFSFNRLACADPILGVEMASTGEIGVAGTNIHEVLLKAMLCQNFKFPTTGILLDIELESDANELAPSLKNFAGKVDLFATTRTRAHLSPHNISSTAVYLPEEKAEPTIKSLLASRTIQCTIQLRDKSRDFLLRRMKQEAAPAEYWIRRLATDFASSLLTELPLAKMFCEAFAHVNPSTIEIEPLEHYVTPYERVGETKVSEK